MSARPLISLVTCSYNQGTFLRAAMQSVLWQGYSPLEYIVIDGGSADDSAQVIREYEHQLAYWVSEADDGQTDALIKGFDRATGEVLGWLCSDDLLLPGALEAVGQYFAANPQIDVVYGDALWINAAGEALRAKREMPWNRFVFLFDHNYLAQPSVFWRRRLFDRVGGLDRRWNLAMDSDLWLRFARVVRPVHLRRYLACMRYYPQQKTRALKPQGRLEDEALRMREAPRLSGLPRLPVRALARAMRWTSKALVGGYGPGIPNEYRRWLERLRPTPAARQCDSGPLQHVSPETQ